MDRIKFRVVDINTALSVSTSVLTVLLTFSAFALSYSVLYELALAHGFQPWLAWLWPLSLDAFVIIATIAVVRNSLRGETTKYPIFLVGAFTLLSIVLNTVDVNNLTWLAEFDPWVTRTIRGSIYVSVHALPPIVVFLSIELAASIGKSEVKRYAEIKSQQQLQLETATLRQQAEAEQAVVQAELNQLAEQRRQLEAAIADLQSKQVELKNDIGRSIEQKRQEEQQPPAAVSDLVIEQARAILAEWYGQGIKPNGSALGRRLGKSDSLGRQLKRRLWPEVVANSHQNDNRHETEVAR